MWIFILCAAVLALLFVESVRPSRFPPGPRWIPIIGNYLLFFKLRQKLGYTHLVWEWLSERYGPLVGVKLGTNKLVIGTNLAVIRELLGREQFDGRPDGFFFRFRSFGERLGLVFVDGDYFTEQKKFVMKHLKSFGLNRSIMEDRISVEAEDLVQYLHQHQKEEIQLPESADVSVLNILWSLVSGKRYELDDIRARNLLNAIHTSFRLQDMSGGILNQMPFLRFIIPELTSFNQLSSILYGLKSFVEEVIQEHRVTISPFENRDLVDAFLNEMKKNEGTDSAFTEKQLVVLLLDLFLAGPETTSSFICFALLYLLHYPEIQDKLQNEMDEVVGKGVQPTLKDRPRLLYMEAFLMELLRRTSVTPTTVSHRAKEDTEVMGYLIPKDTIVLANLNSLHMDKKHWGDPENFRPERFIDENGSIIQDEFLMPFGLGKRRCMGEALAKSVMFLFITAILREFRVVAVPGPLPDLRPIDGATITPPPFKCFFVPRD